MAELNTTRRGDIGAGRHWLAIAVLVAVVLCVFGPTILRCGIFADDYSVVIDLAHASAREVWHHFLHHIAGRNLDILWFTAMFRVSGGSETGIHWVSLCLESANIVLAYLFLWELTGLASLAFPAALWFALMPNHGESHFWRYCSIQGGMAAFFTLLAFFFAARPRPAKAVRLPAILLLFSLGLFTYEQIFLLWPLLLLVYWNSCRNEKDALASTFLGAGFLVALGAAQLTYRKIDPDHWGSATPQFGHVPLRFAQSAYMALAGVWSPPDKGYLAPRWTWIAIALSLIAGYLIVWFERRLIDVEGERLRRYFKGAGPARLVLFGCAWFLLAYLLNYLWYLSSRHNHIPSLGWVVALVAGIGWAAYRWPGLRKVLPAVAVFLFVNDCIANFHEGTIWMFSTRLHQLCGQEAAKFGPGIDNLFLIGAPRELGKTSPFARHPDKVTAFYAFDDVALAAGVPLHRGDIQFAPTLHGAFYDNFLQTNDPHARFIPTLKWLPYERMNVIHYVQPEEFHCVKDVRLTTPDGRSLDRPLRPAPGCSDELPMAMNVVLSDVRESPAHGGASGKAVPGIAGVELVSTDLNQGNGLVTLHLRWWVKQAPAFDFAVVPYVLSDDGKVLFSPLYDAHIPGATLQILWPMYDDERAPSRWSPGKTVDETYLLRDLPGRPFGPHRLELEFYRINGDKPADFLGRL